MTQYANWTVAQLDREIAVYAQCRDACLRGDWGPERHGLADGYQDRIDSLVWARTKKLEAENRRPA